MKFTLHIRVFIHFKPIYQLVTAQTESVINSFYQLTQVFNSLSWRIWVKILPRIITAYYQCFLLF